MPCGAKFLRVLIFAIFPAIRKNKFPQIKITANIFFFIFFSKNLPQSEIFSNLNSLHKNTVLRNRVCSVTTCLFRSETKRLISGSKKITNPQKQTPAKIFPKNFPRGTQPLLMFFFSQHHETSFQGSGQILNGGIFCL